MLQLDAPRAANSLKTVTRTPSVLLHAGDPSSSKDV